MIDLGQQRKGVFAMYGQYPYGSMYQNPYYQQQSQATQQTVYTPQMQQPRYPQTPSSNIEYVNGIEGVKAIPLAPNSVHLVLDSDSKCFYIKRTDMEGRPSIEVHPYTDLDTPQRPVEPKLAYVTVEQFNELKQELERLKSTLTEVKE